MTTTTKRQIEFIPGYGYRYPNGSKVYQEHLPIDRANYSPLFQAGTLHIESCSDGLWVMDNLASFHSHPFETMKAAEKYLVELGGKV